MLVVKFVEQDDNGKETPALGATNMEKAAAIFNHFRSSTDDIEEIIDYLSVASEAEKVRERNREKDKNSGIRYKYNYIPLTGRRRGPSYGREEI